MKPFFDEAIEVALRCLYSSDTLPDIERAPIKLLLKLPVTNAYFQKVTGTDTKICNGASLAFILPNIWMKSLEVKLSAENEMTSGEPKMRHKDALAVKKFFGIARQLNAKTGIT